MTYLSDTRECNCKLNDRFFPRSRPRYVSRFRELVNVFSASAQLVLHLGAGRVDLERHLPQGAVRPRLLALDLSREALQQNPGSLKVCGDAEALPLPSASVDLIVSEHVFEHFPRPIVSLDECFRVLKSGGKLLVSGPNGWSYISLAARLTPLSFHNFMRRLQRATNGSEANGFRTFYRFSTPRSMRRLARKVGLDVVINIETFVGEPCYTTSLPLLHVASIGYHLLLERVHPTFNFHITSVAIFEKPCDKN